MFNIIWSCIWKLKWKYVKQRTASVRVLQVPIVFTDDFLCVSGDINPLTLRIYQVIINLNPYWQNISHKNRNRKSKYYQREETLSPDLWISKTSLFFCSLSVLKKIAFYIKAKVEQMKIKWTYSQKYAQYEIPPILSTVPIKSFWS